LNSPLLKWPDRQTVLDSARAWAGAAGATVSELLKVGVFGSYARGDWGVGSDLDLVVIVSRAAAPRLERASAWDTTTLPVPVDLLVYTSEEWQALLDTHSRFSRTARQEVRWLWERGESAPTD
jgi:predicted nucleotidyltransferase